MNRYPPTANHHMAQAIVPISLLMSQVAQGNHAVDASPNLMQWSSMS